MALFARIFEYLDLPSTSTTPRTRWRSTRPVRGDVRFEDVTLRYPGADRDAVADLTLSVPAGSTLALVGETGSGKTTARRAASRGCTTRTPVG